MEKIINLSSKISFVFFKYYKNDRKKKYNLAHSVQTLILLDIKIKIKDVGHIIRFFYNILYDLEKRITRRGYNLE